MRTRLHQRVASYHFVLERLVLMTPSPEAAQVELALNGLQDQIAHYRDPVPSWGREPSPRFVELTCRARNACLNRPRGVP